jgi:N-acetylmuramoyl-L-alanine amidase-like protein
MARYPAAEWRRVPGTEPAITPRTVIFHTMVGTLAGTDAYFRSGRSGGIESHFGVGGPWEGVQYDGVIYQWRDTHEQADANYHANDFAISIETSDGGQPLRTWTPKQVDALVKLGRWLADEHGIPRRICRSPTDSGFGWHVMFGAPSEWTPVAKTCPGATRIRQLKDEVLPRIFAATDQEADMPLDQTDKQWFVDTLRTGFAGDKTRPVRDWAVQLEQAKAILDAGVPVQLDDAAAAAIAQSLAANSDFLRAIAGAVADEQYRRQKE